MPVLSGLLPSVLQAYFSCKAELIVPLIQVAFVLKCIRTTLILTFLAECCSGSSMIAHLSISFPLRSSWVVRLRLLRSIVAFTEDPFPSA